MVAIFTSQYFLPIDLHLPLQNKIESDLEKIWPSHSADSGGSS